MRSSAAVVIFLLNVFAAHAQKGFIRGVVQDDANNELLIGVTVAVAGTTTGAITDLDGKFSINLDPGTYTLQVSYISFQSQTIEGVVVKPGEATVLNNIRMKQATLEVAEVVVKAEMVRTNESAMMMMKQKSVAMIDGISSEKMQLTGDATAVEAAKRVTGVSVEGGKYVFVRGLGDRYSKTMLNGMDIPGLDPDRNSLQLDIFPSNLIQNITVSKNFTADMPADFTGGMMNIETKDFPDNRILSVSLGLGYNPFMHFNSNYLTYQGGSTDYLGFDDGTRALPSAANSQFIPTPTSGAPAQQVNSFVNSFNPTLGATRQMSPMDFSGSFTYGDQFALKKGGEERGRSLGFIMSLSYKSDYKYYDDVRYGEYQRFSDASLNELRYATVQNGEMGEHNVLLGGMIGLAYKSKMSKVKLTLMHLQSGESRAAKFNIDNDGAAVGQSGYIAYSDNLEYNQRSLTNVLLSGNHAMQKNWDLEWKLSPTLSISDDPDIRKTAFTVTPTNTFFSAGAGGNPSRIWRSLNEVNMSGRVDATKRMKFNKVDFNVKFGALHTYKQRDYEILFFDIQFFGGQSWPDPQADNVLTEANIYNGTSKPNNIYYQSGNRTPNPNQYSSNINSTAGYVSTELDIMKRFKVIAGLRAEYYVQRHTGRDQAFANGDVVNGRNLSDEKVLETINLFPSVNFIYSIDEKQNLRIAYSRTVARPSFKEMSFAQIIDPITNRIFNGGLFRYVNEQGVVSWNGELLETDIDNLDLRWEYFGKRSNMYSVSGFFKHFDNPIELVRIPEQQTSTEFQPRNVGTAYVFGIELEGRTPSWAGFSASANVTIAHSIATMSTVEFTARREYERVGQVVTDKRQMAGQSPYVINVGLNYANKDLGMDVGLFYNVKGPTLEVVGVGLYADVFSEPFHSLNLSFSQKLGKQKKTSIDFKVANILNDRLESFYHSFGAQKQVFSSINPGVSFGLGLSHRF